MNEHDLLRISTLRKDAIVTSFSFDAMYYAFFSKYEKNASLDSEEARYADAYQFAMKHVEPVIDEGELIVGKPVHPLKEQDRADFERLIPMMEEYAVLCGQESHMAVDYPLLLREGTSGITARIDRLRSETNDTGKLRFYDSCKACLHGVELCAERYSAFAQKQADVCTDPVRREELRRIADICNRVPRLPAENFYEAVQSVSFLTYCLSFDPKRYLCQLQFQLGHPDRYLLPFYEKDIAAGKMSKEEAQVLLDCLAIQINHRVPRGLSSGYMVGGRLPDGSVVANDLTEMGMQVIDDIRLVYPSVGYCYTKDAPPHLLEKACEILSHGCSHPAIFNDDLITSGLRSYGVSEEESHEYIHSTCVEITPVAASSIWVASPYHNMPQMLLDLLGREYNSMEELMAVFYTHLDEAIVRANEKQLEFQGIRRRKGMEPLLSCFVNDCLLCGQDIERDGARYRWIMPSFVGIANLVDCLTVIRKVIFEERSMTLSGLKAMIDRNFEGDEPTRLRFLNRIEKYGNDVPEADAMFGEITRHITDFCASLSVNEAAVRLVPSAFCWVMHEQFGRETGATPDGRRAGFPLGDGSGPCQGREHNGPTASIRSATSWDHRLLIGGVAVNMKFSKKTFTADSCKKVESLIRTYMDRGGFELQINVIDRETLLAAQKNPESYRDLVVRIGGYSDYFVCLSPEMQEEVLLRSSHEV